MDIGLLPISLFRRFRAWIIRREVEVVGHCKFCGDCCRDVALRNEGRWIKNDKQFRALCVEDPRYKRLQVTDKDHEGNLIFSCTRQKDNLCTCHDDRMAICKGYPSASIYYRGGWLRPDCGYSFKVVTFRDIIMRRKRARMPSFETVLQQEKDKV